MLRNVEFKQPETVRARTASVGSALSWVSKPEKLGPQLVEKSPRTAEFKQPDCRLSQEGQGASFPIDHITPIARGNATEPDHHTLACVSLSPAENWVCFACPIPPRFVLSFDLLTTNTRANWLCFGAFLSPLASLFGFTEDSSQSSRLTPRATRPTAGSGRTQLLPRWLLLATDRRIAKVRTGPDLDERTPIFTISPNQAIPADKSTYPCPLAAAQPLIILSWPEALDAPASAVPAGWPSAAMPFLSLSPCLVPL